MFNANRTHYEKLTAMCYLLNGRRNREDDYKHFSAGYHPSTIDIRTIDGKPHQVEFNGVDLIYKTLHAKFDGKTVPLRIIVNGENWGNDFEFWDEDAKKTAESIFGEGVSAGSIVTYTEIALKDLCRGFANEINETIASIRCW
jgi:hypothetical protein